MDRRTIAETLEALVKSRSGLKSALDPDARFKEDLEIDSLLVVDIVIDTEKHFNISISEEDILQMSTLNTAIALVERLVAGSRHSAPTGTQERTQPI